MPDNLYRNRLAQLTTDPNSFRGSPGFQFALDSGTQAINRRAAANGSRLSGNVLAELGRYGTGLAQQDYGNEFDRTLRASQGEDQFNLATDRNTLDRELGVGRLNLDRDLGTGQLNLGQGRLALDRDLGTQRLGLDRSLGFGRLGLDRDLGTGQLANTRRGQDLDFGLGTIRAGNDYDLGRRGLDNSRENNYMNYDLGLGRNSTDAYRARTDRGSARSQAWYRGDESQRAWQPYRMRTMY